MVFRSFEFPLINNRGGVAFESRLIGPRVGAGNDAAIHAGGGASLVARTGGPAPGAPAGVRFASFDSLVQNDAGAVAFVSNLTEPDGSSDSIRNAIYSTSAGPLREVARFREPAPGVGPTAFFSLLGGPVLNNAGDTAFSAVLGGGVDATNNRAVFVESGGALGLVARTGDAAPGVPAGVVFRRFGQPGLNDTGQTLFDAELAGPGVTDANREGLFLGSGGRLELVLRGGEPVPDSPAGVTFDSLLGPPRLNNAGEVAFTALLSGDGVDTTNRTGIFAGAAGSLRTVARAGDPAPDVPGGVVIRGFTGGVALNNAGQVAFTALLGGTGVDRENDVSLLSLDPDGVLSLVARTGDAFDVNDDPLAAADLRTIANISADLQSGGSDGRRSAFNDRGQLAYGLRFTDGTSGIFLSDTGQRVPEPAAAAVVLAAGVWLRRRRCA